MVNPAFSESQLKNLRRQNRHLASTHRRKLVFLQASRNPAHGSGRPFFVRDVPVPASFCPAFAPTAPGPCRSPAPTVPPSSPLRTFVSQPLPYTGQSTGLYCARCRSASPPGTPGTVPPDIFLPGSCRFSLRPSGSRFRSSPAPTVPPSSPLRTFVSQPLPYTGQSTGLYCARCRSASPPGTPGTVPPDIFLPGSCRFSLRPSGSRFRRSPAPAVLPSSPLLPSSPSLSRTPDKVRVRTVHAAVPHPRPAPRERSRPGIFLSGPCPFAPPAPVSAAPQLRPFHRPRRSVPSSPSLSRTPDKVRVCTVHAAVPHPRPARRERSRPTSFCPAPVASPLRLPFPQLRRFRSFPPQLRPSPRRPAEPAAPSARHAKRAV